MGKYKLTVTFTTDDYFDDDADLNEITRAIQDEIDMKSTYDVEIKVQDQYCLDQLKTCKRCKKEYPPKYIANDKSGICVNCMVRQFSKHL